MAKPSIESLVRKTSRLLEDATLPGRQALAEVFLNPLSEIGRVGLMGGAVRDLAFMSVKEFSSDLDFVVEVERRERFDAFVESHSLIRNSFGGYRLMLPGLNVDFWEAGQTWAGRQGLRKVATLEDVLNTTFFNIDALIFVVGEHRVIEREGTLESIEQRLLGINLKENPNPIGATVRTLRRMHQFELFLDNELAEFVADSIDANGWDCLVQRDFLAYPARPFLHAIFVNAPRHGKDFLEMIAEHENALPSAQQLEFWDSAKMRA